MYRPETYVGGPGTGFMDVVREDRMLVSAREKDTEDEHCNGKTEKQKDKVDKVDKFVILNLFLKVFITTYCH